MGGRTDDEMVENLRKRGERMKRTFLATLAIGLIGSGALAPELEPRRAPSSRRVVHHAAARPRELGVGRIAIVVLGEVGAAGDSAGAGALARRGA